MRMQTKREELFPVEKVKFNRDQKYDLQLSQALIRERKLADIFGSAAIEKIELKSESGCGRRPAISASSIARMASPLAFARLRQISGFTNCAGMTGHSVI